MKLLFSILTVIFSLPVFGQKDSVKVITPPTESKIIQSVTEVSPRYVIIVTVDVAGNLFFGITGDTIKRNVLASMSDKYKVSFTEKEITEFVRLKNFGCDIHKLPQYLSLPEEKRAAFVKANGGIPNDTNMNINQLKDWIFFGNIELEASCKKDYEQAVSENLNPDIEDFMPKFILKVDHKDTYPHAKQVIEVFRELKIFRLNFVTTMDK